MRMARMSNARVLLFRIPIPEWTERHSIHSAPRSRMNGMLRMKIKDGGRRGECFRFKRVPTRPIYTFGQNETLLLISLYQKYEAYFSDVSYNKKTIWQMIADDMKKSGYSPSATNCENRWKCLTSSFRKCEDNNNKSGRSRHICYAMFTPARFVTQCFLVPGPRIPTCVFLCRQFELFRAFCSNHSYSRIVGKKTRPTSVEF